MRGKFEAEVLWKTQEQFFSVLMGTHERVGKESPIQDLKRLGAVGNGEVSSRNFLNYLLPKHCNISFSFLSHCA